MTLSYLFKLSILMREGLVNYESLVCFRIIVFGAIIFHYCLFCTRQLCLGNFRSRLNLIHSRRVGREWLLRLKQLIQISNQESQGTYTVPCTRIPPSCISIVLISLAIITQPLISQILPTNLASGSSRNLWQRHLKHSSSLYRVLTNCFIKPSFYIQRRLDNLCPLNILL